MRSIFKFLDYLRFYAFTSGLSLARLKFSSRRESSIDKKPSGFPREEVDRTRTKRSENASVGTSRHNSPGTVNHGGRHGAPIEMVIFGHNRLVPTATTTGQYFNSNDKLLTRREYAASPPHRRWNPRAERARSPYRASSPPLPLTFNYTTTTTGLLGQPTGFP